eukprot:m.996640 g.996640  ORF g.996640 m.996640 type:complete len:79 (-) comp24020_c1_seq4:336-572(-)
MCMKSRRDTCENVYLRPTLSATTEAVGNSLVLQYHVTLTLQTRSGFDGMGAWISFRTGFDLRFVTDCSFLKSVGSWAL